MRKIATGSTLVVASHNEGKVREINDLITPFGLNARSAGDLGLAEPEETGTTFAENARLKACAASAASAMVAIADDSGLSVDALDGDPGIYSARWAGPNKDFAAAMRNVEEKLQAAGAVDPQDRGAHFICALCIAWPDGETEVFEGRVSGALVWPPRGANGFGYDPVFVANGHTQTFGEMEPAQKHALSHRADAFSKLTDAIFTDA